jgi:hypothetical protein
MAEDGDIGGIIDAMDPNLGANIGQESSLSNWVGPYVTDMLGMGQALAETPYPSYEGTLTAPISSLQDQAFGGIAGLSVPYEMGETADLALGVGEKAAGMGYDPTDYAGEIGRWTDEGVAESYMNPFIAQALTPQLEEMRRQAEIQRQIEQGQMTSAGAYGGSRSALLNSEMDDNMLRLMAQLTGEGYRDAYNTGAGIWQSDEDRMLEAMGLSERAKQFGANYGANLLNTELDAANLANAMYQDEFDSALRLLQQQKAFGDTERQAIQEGLDADKQQFEYESMWPYQQVQFMQSLLQGLPLEAQQNYYQQPSSLSNILSASGGITEVLRQLFGSGVGGGDSTSPPIDNISQATTEAIGNIFDPGQYDFSGQLDFGYGGI